jgi:hypothetical protein
MPGATSRYSHEAGKSVFQPESGRAIVGHDHALAPDCGSRTGEIVDPKMEILIVLE